MAFKKLLERRQGRDGYGGEERREYAGRGYPFHKRSKLKVREFEPEVVDISEKGGADF